MAGMNDMGESHINPDNTQQAGNTPIGHGHYDIHPDYTRTMQPQSDYVRPAKASSQMGAIPQGGFVPATSGVGQYSRSSNSYVSKRGMSTGKKVGIAVAVIVVLAAIVALALFMFKESQKQIINEGLHDMERSEIEALDQELTGSTTFNEPFTMLLLGSDERSGDPDMGARTDTVILCRIDPTTNTLSMVSIPRDTMITLDGVGTTKFNAAYTYGGPSGTVAAVKDLTGVDVDHYAEINFEGLVGLVDAIGGVEIDVQETIDDPDAGDVVIEPGLQTLDGYEALTYARTRNYADGDFTRVKHQREVIEAILHRGLEAPATELQGLIQTSTEFLTTDAAVDFDFIYSLADQIRHNNDYPVTIYTATIPSGTDMVDGVSYVIADTQGLADMMEAFKKGEDVSKYGTTAGLDQEMAQATGAASAGAADANGNPAGEVYVEESTDTTYYGDTDEAIYYDDGSYDDGSYDDTSTDDTSTDTTYDDTSYDDGSYDDGSYDDSGDDSDVG